MRSWSLGKNRKIIFDWVSFKVHSALPKRDDEIALMLSCSFRSFLTRIVEKRLKISNELSHLLPRILRLLLNLHHAKMTLHDHHYHPHPFQRPQNSHSTRRSHFLSSHLSRSALAIEERSGGESR